MTPIESQVLAKVTNVLSNLGLEWAIKTSDGEVHGNLKIEQPKPRKSLFGLPRMPR